MTKQNVHVTLHKDGWAVMRDGAQRASSIHDTQADAARAGRVIAKAEHSELRIHGRDGRIRDSDSFGNDPNPPKDRKH